MRRSSTSHKGRSVLWSSLRDLLAHGALEHRSSGALAWSIIVSTVKDASAAALGAWCGSLALAEGVATGQEALVPIGQHQKVNTKLGINEHS